MGHGLQRKEVKMVDTVRISELTTGSTKLSDETPATDITDTTQALSGTTKKYFRYDVDTQIYTLLGLGFFTACYAATTANLSATYSNGTSGVGATLTNSSTQAAFSIDGVTPPINSRILVKSQSTGAQNGIYIVTNAGSISTNWVLTRATDCDQAVEMVYGNAVLIALGTTNGNKCFQLTFSGSVTVGATTLTFSAIAIGVPPYPSLSGSYSLGGIAYSTATQLAILAGTATANQIPLSGSSAAPSWSTATYPATTTVSQLLYSSSANTIAGLATTNRASLSTNSTGVPTWLALADGQIVIGSTAGSPAAGTLTAGLNTSITNASNSITVNANLMTRTAVSSSPYVVLTTDYFISVSTASARTIQLPNAPTTNQAWIIKDRTGSGGSNNISVTTVGGVITIDGATTYTINSNFGSIGVLFNGTSYEIW